MSRERYEAETIPIALRAQITELSGTSDAYKGHILFVCNEKGEPEIFYDAVGVTFDGLMNKMRAFINNYDKDAEMVISLEKENDNGEEY